MNSSVPTRQDQGMVRICWKTPLGAVRRSAPMPHYLAAFRAREEHLTDTLGRFWLERCEEVATLRTAN